MRDGTVGALAMASVAGMELAVVLPVVLWIAAAAAPWTVLGPLLTAALLPAGFLASRRFRRLRRDRNRLVVGAATALVLRLVITPLPEAGNVLGVAFLWLVGALVPAALGGVLWWRGGSLAEAELSPLDVRNEFALLGGMLLAMLVLFRDLVAANPLPVAGSVVLFLACGLVASGAGRQDASGATVGSGARGLALVTALAPVGLSALLAIVLRPDLAVAIWHGIGTLLSGAGFLIGLLLSPLLSLLFSWLKPGPLQMPERPPEAAFGPPAAAEPAQLPQWLAVLFVVVGVLAALAVAALLLWAILSLLAPGWRKDRRRSRGPVATEADGEPGADARALLAGVGHWLGRRVRRPRGDGSSEIADVRAAYRALLRWAKGEGVVREAWETPEEFASRLRGRFPAGAAAFADLTEAYEDERYGSVHVGSGRLASLRARLEGLPLLPRRDDESAAGGNPDPDV